MKNTFLVIGVLAVVAAILLGINIGKRISETPVESQPTSIISSPQANIFPSPTTYHLPLTTTTAISTFTDETCGFSFSYPGSYMRQKTANQKSVIFVDPNDPKVAIAATCAPLLPRPLVAEEQQESVTLAGEPATLYHDRDPEGNLRDEIIVKHPTNGMEIIIAGYGAIFESVRANFQFI